MPEGGSHTLEHATTVAIGGRGVLLRGPSGAGKSDLALRLIDAGAELVADDQSELFVRDGALHARAPKTIAGKIEVRGLGVVGAPLRASAPVALVVELTDTPERFPQSQSVMLAGWELPVIQLRAIESSAPAKIRIALAAHPASARSTADDETILLVTGLSGGGRTLTLKALEDAGYEVIDNLPFALLEAVRREPRGDKPLAIGIDSRARGFSADAMTAWLKDASARLIFIECDDETLQRRFTETRRPHPLAKDRPLSDGIAAERALLAPLRQVAEEVIDTTGLPPAELRTLISARYGLESQPLTVTVTSFSFKEGLPREADLVFDVRFLRNPHYDDRLRAMTGRDEAVARFVAEDPDYDLFFERLTGLLEPLLPRYSAEGKSYLTIAVGCTGGRHRSVAVAQALGAWLSSQERDETLSINVVHRDLP